MKKKISYLFCFALIASLSSCSTVGSLPTDKLESMYEKRVNKTSIFNKLFFKDHKKKKIVYENIDIYMDENSVDKPFETVAFSTYGPLIIPLLRPEKRSLEHNLLYKAARTAYKMKADAVIIDSKNDFRVIKYKK
ncbi:MAG: hypothetical protein K2M93_01205 [Muribaculaceae bacterium]|nr:hypothetical protein [Muribaculaceae bacterium]